MYAIECLDSSPESVLQIADFITHNEYLLPDPFSIHIDILSYAEKLNQFGITFVARNQDRIVGLISGYCNDTSNCWAFVQVIIVGEDCQGIGLGKQLLFRFIEYARNIFQRGTIFLTVDVCNDKARAFYANLGFQKSSIKVHTNPFKEILEYQLN